MSGAGVHPTVRLQRSLILALSAWTLAGLGVICSVPGLPWSRSCVRRVCSRQSKPCAMGVMTVFVGDSLTPRSARKALIRGRTVSSKTCREVAVTMKSSAQPTSLMVWTRRCQRPPCPTVSRPSHTIRLTTGEIIPPGGTPAVVGSRVPRSRTPRRSHLDRTRLGMGMCASIHENRL
jgi:hypothetical protein